MYEFHGMLRTRTYSQWNNMRQRCFNKNNPQFKDYGGRGITVCKEWNTSFKKFFSDMGECPPGLCIDRINNNKGYNKKNCRWVSYKENCRNKRNNKKLTYMGKTMCVIEWAEYLKIPPITIYQRIKYGFEIEKVLNPGVFHKSSRCSKARDPN